MTKIKNRICGDAGPGSECISLKPEMGEINSVGKADDTVIPMTISYNQSKEWKFE